MTEPILKLRDAELFWREVEDQIVVLDGRAWEYLDLNASGRLLWRRLAEGASLSDLTTLLTDTFPISPAQAGEDVESFVADLRERGLLSE